MKDYLRKISNLIRVFLITVFLMSGTLLLSGCESISPTTVCVFTRSCSPDVVVDKPKPNQTKEEVKEILRHDDLTGIDLTGVDLHDANLRGRNLSRVKLSGADLHDAKLQGAKLREADLSGADLRNANLSGADLTGANLSGADLTGANLEGTKMPT